jgi:hypothetical protein
VSSGYYGRRETGLDYSQVSGDTTQMTTAGNQQIALTELSQQAITVPLTHGNAADGFYEPYASYKPGDTIALDVPGSYSMSPFAIAALTCKQTAANDYEPSVNLGAVVISGPEALGLAVRQMITSVTGSTSGIGASLAGFLTMGNPKGFPMGPTLPANASAGMVWFYTKAGVNEWCYCDGARWLGQPRLQSSPITASDVAVIPIGPPWPSDIYLTKWQVYAYEGGLCDGYNYHNISLYTDSPGQQYAAIATVTTAAIGSGNPGGLISGTINSTLSSLGSLAKYWNIRTAIAAGTPSGLVIKGIVIEYRPIYT